MEVFLMANPNNITLDLFLPPHYLVDQPLEIKMMRELND